MASRRKKKVLDDGLERIHVRIPADLAMRLRVRCIEGRKSLAEGVADAVRSWLKLEKPVD